jgi:hypothetical protein
MQPEIVQGYTIIERAKVFGATFVLGENPKAPSPYVVWAKDAEGCGYHWGHYFQNKGDGIEGLYAICHREAHMKNEQIKEHVNAKERGDRER